MIKKLITEISEEDFRKLDLTVFRNERIEHPNGGNCFGMVEKKLNDILDKEIQYGLDAGTESDLKDFDIPVTIAIHEPDGYYLDKYMNRFTGAQTFQIGWGISHLYSTRDYYEAHEDYWRVRKDETKVIYRVKLSPEWKKKFVLKHKTESTDWPFENVPEGVSKDFIKGYLCTDYDLSDEGEWIEVRKWGRFIYECCEHHIPVDDTGLKLKKVDA